MLNKKYSYIHNNYIKYLYLFIAIFFTVSILYISNSYDSVFAKKNSDDDGNKDDDGNDQKLDLKTSIELSNIDNIDATKFLRITGFVNGQEIKKDIPISSIDKTKKTLNVDFKLDSKTDLVNAKSPDEFFVCAYQVGEIKKDQNSIIKFDCNEGDLQGAGTTQVSLFKTGSQVFATSQAVHQKATLTQTNSNSANNNGVVKIKIYSPMSDKKDAKKLKIAVALDGQIQSQIIDDVQAELDKSKDNTIKRVFTFDRNTDLGPIQVGDRYHSCVAGEDLRPPEGSECEKRIIKNLDSVSGLYVR